MKREREELIDFVLHELSADRHHEVAERIARDPAAAAERDELVEGIALLRLAAAEGWPARGRTPARVRFLRPAIAVAAVLLVAVGLLFVNGASPETLYEPDDAFGYLHAEETDSEGRVYETSQADDEYLLRRGAVTISALGSESEFTLGPGETFPPESELRTPAETGARIDLPGGGILFMGPISTVRVRRHQDGGPALRIVDGVACTVAEGGPVHLAVHETDLLLVQESGAAVLRESPAEAIALRGELHLRLADGKRFRVPVGERIPAACATAPQTAAVKHDYVDLQWYRDLVYDAHRCGEIAWESAGRSAPLAFNDATLVFLKATAKENTTLEVAFGGEARSFTLREGVTFRLRLRLGALGPGPQLTVTPAGVIEEARLLEATPR